MMSWKQSILATALSAILLSPAVFAQSAPAANAYGEEAIEFTARSGESVAAFHGTVSVPENRADPASRMIEVSYIRFPATGENPGSPIVYLSGGPGGSGSGTARGPRFPLFQEMRRHGDVIAFDQRGTGGSTELPRCVSSQSVAETERISDAEYAAAYRRAVEECGVFWREQGVDVRGYTTRESVQDLAALRTHLGAGQISLWGISYGSHLALAALKDIPEQLDRVILASAEGLDQTAGAAGGWRNTALPAAAPPSAGSLIGPDLGPAICGPATHALYRAGSRPERSGGHAVAAFLVHG